MNKPIKILLLVVATLSAFGGVMVYYKTIVSPPGHLAFKNQYIEASKIDIFKLKSYTTDYTLDSTFVSITHELDFLLTNSLLSEQERNELLELFATQYVPAYTKFCNSQFKLSEWDENQLQRIKERVSELFELTTSDDMVVIQGPARSSLNEVLHVIDIYYDAKTASYARGYYGIDSAKERIAEANQYASMSPINNCTELVSRLNSVSSRLEQDHYAYLEAQVERLRYYYNYSQDEYDNLALSIADKLEEYKKNAKSTYGYISDIGVLENRAGEYYENASFDLEIL